ncbi:MAG: hypothetical protein LBV77_05470 [Candidatus Adiutrix intracellularis]|nr:hypothetical protein [Candidatus Adiutrix intracellularis]
MTKLKNLLKDYLTQVEPVQKGWLTPTTEITAKAEGSAPSTLVSNHAHRC